MIVHSAGEFESTESESVSGIPSGVIGSGLAGSFARFFLSSRFSRLAWALSFFSISRFFFRNVLLFFAMVLSFSFQRLLFIAVVWQSLPHFTSLASLTWFVSVQRRRPQVFR